jgi:MFS family permease
VHTRLALLYSIGLVASGFAGVLAYGIGQMDGVRGWRGWRWIFTIEGVVTLLAAFVLWWFIDDFPDRAKFLTPEEKSRVIAEIEADRGHAETEKLTWEHVQVLKGRLSYS